MSRHAAVRYQSSMRALHFILVFTFAVGCKSAGDDAGSGGSGGTGGGGTGAAGGGTASTTSSTTTSGSGGDGGGGSSSSACSSTFTGANGAPWPSPWTEAGGVADADLSNGRGRLTPVLSGYSLGRMRCLESLVNVELLASFSFANVATQGMGFYVRQNGGYLQQSNPTGAGYAVFVEGFSGQPGVGFWYERTGTETLMVNTPFALANGVLYWLRYRVTQADPTHTLLQAKVWADGSPEPASFAFQHTDDQDHLQSVAGQIAIDAWNTAQTGGPAPADVYLDSLVVTAL